MNQELLSFLTEAVKAASGEGRLIDERELAEASSRHFSETVEILPSQVREALASADPKQIGRFDGAEVRRYYDRSQMADSYAETLNLIEEGNTPRMIAETVRTNARVYPRPTMIDEFRGAPYKLNPEELTVICAKLAEDDGEYSDIERVDASNGDSYLYSTSHLSTPRAQYLAEWESVEQLENQ